MKILALDDDLFILATVTSPDYCKTPIIMLTAMTEQEFVDRNFKTEAAAYASKTFDIFELNSSLRTTEELVLERQPLVESLDHGPLEKRVDYIGLSTAKIACRTIYKVMSLTAGSSTIETPPNHSVTNFRS